MRNQTPSSAIQMEEIGFEKEWKEWDTDSIVQEACERVFGFGFTGWYPEIDIEFSFHSVRTGGRK